MASQENYEETVSVSRVCNSTTITQKKYFVGDVIHRDGDEPAMITEIRAKGKLASVISTWCVNGKMSRENGKPVRIFASAEGKVTSAYWLSHTADRPSMVSINKQKIELGWHKDHHFHSYDGNPSRLVYGIKKYGEIYLKNIEWHHKSYQGTTKILRQSVTFRSNGDILRRDAISEEDAKNIYDRYSKEYGKHLHHLTNL